MFTDDAAYYAIWLLIDSHYRKPSQCYETTRYYMKWIVAADRVDGKSSIAFTFETKQEAEPKGRCVKRHALQKRAGRRKPSGANYALIWSLTLKFDCIAIHRRNGRRFDCIMDRLI